MAPTAAPMIAGLFCLAIGFMIFVPVGAIILRAAISLANKFLGPSGNAGSEEGVIEDVKQEPGNSNAPRDLSNPYAPSAHEVTANPIKRGGSPIPNPTFGFACVITIVSTVAGFVVGFVAGIIGSVADMPVALVQVANVTLGFVVNVMANQALIPTTTGRAALVCVCQYLIYALILAVIVGAVFAFDQFGRI